MPANLQSPTWPETPSRVYTRSGVSGKVRIPIAFQLGERHRGTVIRQKPHPACTHGAEFPTGCPTSSARMPESSPHVYTRDRVSDELPHLECPDARKLPLRVHAGCTFRRRGSSRALPTGRTRRRARAMPEATRRARARGGAPGGRPGVPPASWPPCREPRHPRGGIGGLGTERDPPPGPGGPSSRGRLPSSSSRALVSPGMARGAGRSLL